MLGRARSLAVFALAFAFIVVVMSGGKPNDLLSAAMTTLAADDCIDCALFGTIKLEPESGGTAPASQFLQLSEVRPESGVGWAVTHDGPSVLYVEEGVLCYALSGSPSLPVQVERASVPAVPAPDLMADPPDSRCATYEACDGGIDIDKDGTDDAVGCILEQSAANPAPAVLLYPGDSVSQGGTTNRYYQNVGITTARLLFSNLQPSDTGQLPCGGGCH